MSFLTDHVTVTHLEAAEAAPEVDSPAPSPPRPNEVNPVATAVGPAQPGLVTHYGVQYNGSRMGCLGEPYSSEDETIIAVGPNDFADWPCGTNLRVCGPTGCVTGFRQDSCPGCGDNHLDLSEAAISIVCGDQAHVCRVGIEEIIYEADPLWLEVPLADEALQLISLQ